jgi:hypothetical protein
MEHDAITAATLLRELTTAALFAIVKPAFVSYAAVKLTRSKAMLSASWECNQRTQQRLLCLPGATNRGNIGPVSAARWQQLSHLIDVDDQSTGWIFTAHGQAGKGK